MMIDSQPVVPKWMVIMWNLVEIMKKLVKTNSVNRPTAAGDGNIQEEKPENELSKQPLDLVNY